MQNRDIYYILNRLDAIEARQRTINSAVGVLGSIVDQMRHSTYSLSTHTHSAPFDSAAKANSDGVGLVAHTSGITTQTTLVGTIISSGGTSSGYVSPMLIINPSTTTAASATNINARFNKDTLSLQFYGVWRDYPE
jgi:hypothetical protein